jgi:uncharacterized protein (DUF488 family)
MAESHAGGCVEVRKAYTIGFTQRSAEDFFETLKRARIGQLVDVRLNNVSQLAGFSKKDDLAYFLRAVCGASYSHEPLLAPTQPLLDEYRKKKGSWEVYEASFRLLLRERRVEKKIPSSIFDTPCVLLCSEHGPEKCHRRLVVEYLQECWGDLQIVHL